MMRYLVVFAASHLLAVHGFALSYPFHLPANWYATIDWCIKCILALGAASEANALLNTWAENRWAWRNEKSGWDWKNEVAVVTGGSNGIGACVVKKLVSHGIKVAVLDVAPLANDFSKGTFSTNTYIL